MALILDSNAILNGASLEEAAGMSGFLSKIKSVVKKVTKPLTKITGKLAKKFSKLLPKELRKLVPKEVGLIAPLLPPPWNVAVGIVGGAKTFADAGAALRSAGYSPAMIDSTFEIALNPEKRALLSNPVAPLTQRPQPVISAPAQPQIIFIPTPPTPIPPAAQPALGISPMTMLFFLGVGALALFAIKGK